MGPYRFLFYYSRFLHKNFANRCVILLLVSFPFTVLFCFLSDKPPASFCRLPEKPFRNKLRWRSRSPWQSPFPTKARFPKTDFWSEILYPTHSGAWQPPAALLIFSADSHSSPVIPEYPAFLFCSTGSRYFVSKMLLKCPARNVLFSRWESI